MISREDLMAGKEYPVTWELYPTTTCNLRCTYCYNALKDHSFKRVPHPQYTIEQIVSFFRKYAREGDYLSFIGGEPFMRLDWVREIISATGRFGFSYLAYTNATLLKTLSPSLLNRFGQLNVSIDGDEEQNDRTRGQGTFRRICENLEAIKPDYRGQLVARMTVTMDNNLKRSVENLLSLPYFDVIYWQYQNRCPVELFPTDKKWKELHSLIELWMQHLRQGRVLPLHPFVVIVTKLLGLKRKSACVDGNGYPPEFTLGCGAGYDYVQIFTTGEIFACPELIMNAENRMGSIREGIRRRIELKDFPNTNKCRVCAVFEICHCRCLHFTPDPYCSLIRNTISALQDEIPLIEDLIARNVVNENDFEVNSDIEEMF